MTFENGGCCFCGLFFLITLSVVAFYGIIITPIRLNNLNSVKDELSTMQIINLTVVDRTYDVSREIFFSILCQSDQSLINCGSISKINLTSGYCQDGYYCCKYHKPSGGKSDKKIYCLQDVNNVVKSYYVADIYSYNMKLTSPTIKNPIIYSFKLTYLDNSTYYMGFVVDDKYLSPDDFNKKKDEINEGIELNEMYLKMGILYWSLFGFFTIGATFSFIVKIMGSNHIN